MSFYDQLISLTTMSSRFVFAVACVRISVFLRLNNIPLYGYATYCLSIHPSIDTWVPSSFCEEPCYNLGAQISVHITAFVSFGYVPGSGNAESYGAKGSAEANMDLSWHREALEPAKTLDRDQGRGKGAEYPRAI